LRKDDLTLWASCFSPLSVGVNVVDGFVVAVDVDVLFTVAVVVVVGSVVVQIRLDVEFGTNLVITNSVRDHKKSVRYSRENLCSQLVV